MSKKIRTVAAMIGAVAMLSSCSITLPVNATGNQIGGKVGTAKATGFFHVLYFNADASIQSAAKNAGITRISTVDIKHTDILGIIQTHETIVTGD